MARRKDWVNRGRDNDCLTACVSRLLGINYEEVPFYGNEIDSTWLEKLRTWANKKGYNMYMEWTDSIATNLPEKLIGVGKSPSGRPCDHAVIIDNKFNVIWDPAYNKKRSIEEVIYVLVFKEK